jgi:hypothetical protein
MEVNTKLVEFMLKLTKMLWREIGYEAQSRNGNQKLVLMQ